MLQVQRKHTGVIVCTLALIAALFTIGLAGCSGSAQDTEKKDEPAVEQPSDTKAADTKASDAKAAGKAEGTDTQVGGKDEGSGQFSDVPKEPIVDPASSKGQIVSRAVSCIGIPMIWGGCSPNGCDSSGLVSYCCTGSWQRIGNTTTFMSWGQTANPQPGDICVNVDNCGIYVGSGMMISASGQYGVVSATAVQEGMIFVEYSR